MAQPQLKAPASAANQSTPSAPAVLALTADQRIDHVPSPARELQQTLADSPLFHTQRDTSPQALLLFVGGATLLWGAMIAAVGGLMVLVR